MSLANAFSSAISNLTDAVGNALGGVFTGANPITQPQFGSIFNTSIPATPLISTRDYFLFQLQSWITTFPLQSQWIALIESYPAALNTSIIQGLERGNGSKNAYDINAAKTLLTAAPFQRVSGCLFCNYCQLPPESFSLATASVPNNRGFIPGVVAGPRKSYADNPLTLGFFETNTSFIDNIIRPWVMLASHYGLVAREGDTASSRSAYNVKTTIYLLYYSRTYQKISQVPRKIFKFYNCVPTTVSNQEYTYEEASTVKSYNVNFAYSNYTVENNLFLPIPTIINTFQTGGGGVTTLPAVT
jgi:hypothetical protein